MKKAIRPTFNPNPDAHENKHGQTIGVKYYVNKRLNPKPYKLPGNGGVVDSFPLYIRITAKQQTVIIRSSLDLYSPSDLVDTLLIEKSQDIQEETELIRKTVLDAKPFDTENFNLASVIRGFNPYHHDLRLIVETYLKKDFYVVWQTVQEAFQRDRSALLPEAFAEVFTAAYDEHAQHIELNLMADRFSNAFNWDKVLVGDVVIGLRPFIPAIQELYERYDPIIWRFHDLCNLLSRKNNSQLLTVADWRSRRFDDLFFATGGSVDKLLKIKYSLRMLQVAHKEFFNLLQDEMNLLQ